MYNIAVLAKDCPAARTAVCITFVGPREMGVVDPCDAVGVAGDGDCLVKHQRAIFLCVPGFQRHFTGRTWLKTFLVEDSAARRLFVWIVTTTSFSIAQQGTTRRK